LRLASKGKEQGAVGRSDSAAKAFFESQGNKPNMKIMVRLVFNPHFLFIFRILFFNFYCFISEKLIFTISKVTLYIYFSTQN
jgi:hypothetical protein